MYSMKDSIKDVMKDNIYTLEHTLRPTTLKGSPFLVMSVQKSSVQGKICRGTHVLKNKFICQDGS